MSNVFTVNVYSLPISSPLTFKLVTSFPRLTAFARVPSAGLIATCTPAKSSSSGLVHVRTAFPSAAVTARFVTFAGAVVSIRTSGSFGHPIKLKIHATSKTAAIHLKCFFILNSSFFSKTFISDLIKSKKAKRTAPKDLGTDLLALCEFI